LCSVPVETSDYDVLFIFLDFHHRQYIKRLKSLKTRRFSITLQYLTFWFILSFGLSHDDTISRLHPLGILLDLRLFCFRGGGGSIFSYSA